MTTKEAMDKYVRFINSIKEEHIAKLPKDVYLEQNEKGATINNFFSDLDTKAVLKADELFDEFPSLGDRAILSNRFLVSLKECNSEFKEVVKHWNSVNGNSPTEY